MKDSNSTSPNREQLEKMLNEGVISQSEFDRAVALLEEDSPFVATEVDAPKRDISVAGPSDARLKDSEQHGAVRGMSPVRFDIEPLDDERMTVLSESTFVSKLKKLSITSASVLGVMFVTVTIGFTNLDPTVAMRNDVERSEQMKALHSQRVSPVPLVKKSTFKEERLPYNAYIESVFGPDAVARCMHACLADEGRACKRSCERYSTKGYMDRELARDASPEGILENVGQVCLESTPRYESNRTRIAWSEDVRNTMQELHQYPRLVQGVKWGEAKLRYNRLNQLNRRLALPWGASGRQKKLIGLLSETTCLRMHLAGVEMELIRAVERGSDHLEDYLDTVRETLRDHAVKREVDLLKHVHAMRQPAEPKS